jgi:hypothetical protein
MFRFFKVYKKTRKSYAVVILLLAIVFLFEAGILVREKYLYSKYGSMEVLKWFDYGNGDINFDGSTDEVDYDMLQTALTPYLQSDNSFDQSGVNYVLAENIREYMGIENFDDYLLTRTRNRADCFKDDTIDINDLSELEKKYTK